jgi:GntR family transcriptional regulator/MocR family aminotransferase
MREFKSHLYDSLRDTSLLSYGAPEGHPQLLEEVATYLRRVRGVDHREIVITHGSQEAIFLLAQLLIGPGDAVVVESLGYPPALEALRFSGATLVPVSVDQDGLDIEGLERAIAKHRIRMIYLTPLHQYPTMATYSASRRLALYELAQKHGILILEDDYDHEYHYTSQPIAPLASFDPAGLVLYVSTFSKVLFPSARVGFLAVPKPIGTEVARLKRISSRQNEQLMQAAIARWMKAGGFESHLRRMRRTYHSRRDAIVEDLYRWKKRFESLEFVEPDGGMAVWMNIGVDSSKFSSRADKASILVNPEQSYRLDGRAGTHLRLGFAGQTEAENRVALNEMFKILER